MNPIVYGVGTVLIRLHSLEGIGELREKAMAAEKAANPTEDQQKSLLEWKQLGDMFEPKKANVEKEVKTHRGGWLENLPLRSGEAAMFEFTMFFQFLFLDVLAMLVMGMGLAKAGVFDASRLTSILCTLFFNGYVLGMWAINLTISPIWLCYFRFGPAEWAWQPLRRDAAIIEFSS